MANPADLALYELDFYAAGVERGFGKNFLYVPACNFSSTPVALLDNTDSVTRQNVFAIVSFF